MAFLINREMSFGNIVGNMQHGVSLNRVQGKVGLNLNVPRGYLNRIFGSNYETIRFVTCLWLRKKRLKLYFND